MQLMNEFMKFWYLSHVCTVNAQASLHASAVFSEHLLAYINKDVDDNSG